MTTRQKQIWNHGMMWQRGWWNKGKRQSNKNIDLEVNNISYVVINKYSSSVYYNTKYEARRDVKMQWFLCC